MRVQKTCTHTLINGSVICNPCAIIVVPFSGSVLLNAKTLKIVPVMDIVVNRKWSHLQRDQHYNNAMFWLPNPQGVLLVPQLTSLISSIDIGRARDVYIIT